MAEEKAKAVSDTDPGNEQFTADDWAMAMAEQTEAATPPEVAKPARTSSTVFGNISDDAGLDRESAKNLDLVMDIPVQLTVELGRTRMPIRNLLQLAQGSVVELDELAGEPLDVFVNRCLVAQGEVVVVNEKFGIRLTEIITPSERLKKIRRCCGFQRVAVSITRRLFCSFILAFLLRLMSSKPYLLPPLFLVRYRCFLALG
jgi:flagellar motor switch protein FliN/FliY